MEKSRSYLNNKSVFFIFFIAIMFACSKKVSAKEISTFTIDKVTVGQKEATVTANTKDTSVYIAQVDGRSVGDGYIISGKVDADARVSATDFEGKNFSVEKNGTDFSIKKEEEESYTINGASVCYVTVQEGTASKEYKVVVSGSSSWNNIKETYIADTTNDEINYFDNNTVIQGNSTKDTSYREFTVKDEVKQCSVFRWTNHQKTEKYSANAMEWLSNGENYVRINGNDFQRFESSASYSDTFSSPQLNLKKGLNVIEMYSAEWRVSVLDVASGTMPEGLKKSDLKGYSCAVYLVYSNGTEGEAKKNSNTDIKYVEATQLGSASVKSTSYNVKNENGQWKIALPLKMPLDKIILGVVPEDPSAKVEYMDTSSVKGEQIGMYVALSVGDSLDKVTVKITASDGTSKIYTINLVRANADCDLTQIELKNAKLRDYETKKETEFSSDKTVYLLQQTGNQNAEFTVKEVSNGAVVSINKKEVKSIVVNGKDFLTEVKVIAEDGIELKKYYFIYQDKDSNIPMFESSSENTERIDKAKEILKPYTGQSGLNLKNMWDNSCWSVFMNMSVNIDVKEGYVYSPEKEQYTQATVYARQILQLVMLGYNPYDFGDSHMNLVEGLLSFKNEEGLFGGYANNEWALLALRACGENIPDALINYVKKVDLYNSYSVDMRGWALVALQGLIPEEEYIEGIISLKDEQNENGTWGNINTTGCVISGFVGAGVNMDYLNYDGKDILDICKEQNYEDAIAEAVKKNDGVTLKDIVIAMGDVIQGSNVWQRYNLDEEKWDNIILKATTINEKQPDDDLKNILDKATQIKQEKQYTGNGKVYYELYEKVCEKDDSLKQQVYFEQPKVVTPENGKHYAITEYTNSVNNPNHGWYNRIRFMVRDKNLTPQNTAGALMAVDSPDIDFSQYTYKAMNGNLFSSKAVTYRNTYQDKVYILLLISNTAIQGDEVNTRTADALIEYGPVKADSVKPELYLGNDNENMEKNSTLLLNPNNKEIYIRGVDATSGICNILYQLDDGEWITAYDAATDDNIDVDNECGLKEKDIKIPVEEKAQIINVKVVDVAGWETVSSVKVIKKSQFKVVPKTIVGNDNDITLNLEMNGNDVASVLDGEETLDETSYEVDSKNETITLKKEYLEKLEAGEHQFTIKFSNDGQLIDSDLKMTLSIDSSDNQLKKLSDKVNALDDITLDKESDVEEAKEFYDNMSDELQNQVSDELQKKLSDASEKISALKEDKAKAQEVEDKVRAIGNVDLSKGTIIKEARNAYEALTDSQKAFVSQEVLQELQNAESKLQKLKEANVDPRPSDETNVQKLNFKVKKQTTTSITLKWNTISKSDGYQLRRYDKNKKKYVVVTELKKSQNSYNFKRLKGKKGEKLTSGTIYKLNIRSYNLKNGKKIYNQSEVITAITSPIKTSLTVAGVSRNKIRISWKKVKRASGYKIYVKEGKKSKYRLVKKVNKSNKIRMVIPNLKNGKTYFIKVYSYKKIGSLNVMSKKSNVRKVRIK